MQNSGSLLSKILPWAFAALSIQGCKESSVVAKAPDMVLTPNAVVFDGVQVGEFDEQSILVENAGEGTLTITDLSIDGPQGVFSVTEGFSGDQLVVEPGGTHELWLEYAPVDDAAASGTLTIVSSDPDNRGITQVSLSVFARAPRIFVNPNPVSFGKVDAETHAEVTARITNIGGAPLTVDNYFIITGNFGIAPSSAFTEPFTLAPGEEHPVTLTFDPTDDDFEEGHLIVDSTDPATPSYDVEILGNGAEPCIEITPSGAYDFGERQINVTHQESFSIRNCADENRGQPLHVTSLVLEEGSSATYALVNTPEMSREVPLELAPGEARDFVVTFTPTVDLQIEEGAIVVESTDPYDPVVRVTLNGQGSSNVCPTARATCTVRGSTAPPVTDLLVIPLQTLACSGEASTDEDGDVVDYIWEIVQRPDGSTATPTPDNARNSEFFVDLAGRYTLNLRVVDDRGCTSEPAPVTIVSRPDEDIHVQLVWNTPADADETDEGFGAGSDVDLHVLHPNGCWEDTSWDCHFRARQPNWGDPSRSDDDPSLDIDDTDGAGPENINLNNPQTGSIYKFAAHYYDDHGFGEAYVDMRLYVFGELMFASLDRRMANDEWWVVAAIEWPSANLTTIDRMYPTVPTCP